MVHCLSSQTQSSTSSSSISTHVVLVPPSPPSSASSASNSPATTQDSPSTLPQHVDRHPLPWFEPACCHPSSRLHPAELVSPSIYAYLSHLYPKARHPPPSQVSSMDLPLHASPQVHHPSSSRLRPGARDPPPHPALSLDPCLHALTPRPHVPHQTKLRKELF